MRKILLLTAVSLYSYCGYSQNVGVDVATPQQKLDVAGGLKLGGTTNGVAGSLRWSGSAFQFHDGTQWITLNANTDDQILDVIQLVGNDLQISLENDGQPTEILDLSPFMDNTDDQTFDQISINGSNQLLLSLEGDGQPTHILDLSGYLDNTDDQTFDVISLSGTDLQFSLENDGLATHVIDLSGFMDNTDDQTIDNFDIVADELRLSLEDDGQPLQTVDLSGFLDNTDDQTVDDFSLSGTDLRISLEDDGQPLQTVDLSGFLDNTDDQNLTLSSNTLALEDGGSVSLTPYLDNTDDQTVDNFDIVADQLRLSLEDDGQPLQTVDLSGFLDNTDDQTVDEFSISGTELRLSLEDDGQPLQTVDLAAYLDNTDDQNLTGSLTGTTLDINIEDGTDVSFDLDPLRRQLIDADDDTKVEVEANTDEDIIRFTTAGDQAMAIDAAGNVGIGVEAPVANTLAVKGGLPNTAPVSIRNGKTNAVFEGPQIAFGFANTATLQHFIHTRHSDLGPQNNAIDFYVSDGSTANNSMSTGSTQTMTLEAGNVGIGTTNPQRALHVTGDARLTGLSGSGNRNVLVNNNGDLILGSSSYGGDITGVTAGNGLGGGGTSGNVTLDVQVNNGLSIVSDEVRLGGTLVQNTTVAQGNFSMEFNMTGSGDLNVRQNGGTTTTQFRNDGLLFHGDDMYWRDGSISGTNLMSLWDDGNDGRLIVYENGSTSVDLDANTHFVFNEQGLNRDFRVESDGNANMFRVDASTNRVGIGVAAPSSQLEVYGATQNIEVSNTSETDAGIILNDAQATTSQYARITYGSSDNDLNFLVNSTTPRMVVESSGEVGIGTVSPTQRLDVNGSVRIRGGNPNPGDVLMATSTNGTATWSRDGYGMVPIGSIVAWHKNMGSVPGLPTGWVECNGGTVSDGASPMNGRPIPNLNGGGTSNSGDGRKGRFLRGHTSSGQFENEQTNQFYQANIHDDDDGCGDNCVRTMSENGGWSGWMGYWRSNDAIRFRLRGVETRPVNMSVVYIMRIK